MRPRVVMLLENNSYPQDVRVRNEAEALTGGGFDVQVIAPRSPGQRRRERVDGVRVSRFGLPSFPASRGGFVTEYLVANVQLHVRGAVSLLRGAAVLHIHNPPDTLFGVGLLARALGRRVVFDQHDLAPELLQVKFGRTWMVRVFRWCERASLRVANVVLSENESNRELQIERGAVAADAITVVRNGPKRHTIAAEARVREGSLRDPRLVFVGSMGSEDGLEILPRLIACLREEHGLEGVHLMLVGDGSERASLEREFAARRLSAHVSFVGHVKQEDVPDLIAQADICLDTADGNEFNHRSTMIKIAEYMAAAKPIVAFRLVETERTAADSAAYASCRSLDELADRITELARDSRRRGELARRGRERVQAFVWERSEYALLDAYRSLFPNSPSRRLPVGAETAG
jgi:glycosyltransferase involved in cell wall biosynthesis